ncbi:MAG: hypothetical protein K6360_06605 [Deltaproteobacteria bacterium]
MPGTLLIIGIHREELAFGEQVARLLAGSSCMDVLKIESGLSDRRPTPSGLLSTRPVIGRSTCRSWVSWTVGMIS